MALNSNQEKICRFVIYSHNLQKPDSNYFAQDGGISLSKVAGNVGLDEATTLSECQAMQLAGQIELTTRPNGTGIRALNQTFSEINTINASNKAALDIITAAQIKTAADSIKDSSGYDGFEWRALTLIILDELNDLRKWTRDFKTEVASATNLSNLQARVATLPTLSNRTLAQAKSSYSNKISDGSSD